MRVEWYPEAEDDLEEIISYIFPHNPVAALQIEDLLMNAAKGLAVMPEMGRLGRAFGTRELVVHPNYMLIYRVNVPIVYITAGVHTSRHYPESWKSSR